MNDQYLEKALEKVLDRRALILLASKRAETLARGERPLIKANEISHLDIALLEIAEELISYDLTEGEQTWTKES